MRKRMLFAIGSIGLVSLSACESVLTGNEGNFQFSYEADDRINDFNKPIAVGASLDIEVRTVGARQPVTLTQASSTDPGVLQVASFADQNVTVTGTGEGTTLLEVQGTTVAGRALTDSVNLQSRVPEVLQLRHTCRAVADRSAAYLTAQRVWVPFELEMSNTQPVIGYGYYPIEELAGASVNVSDSNQTHIAIDTGKTAADLTLTSRIDETTLDLKLVTGSQIDGVVEPIAFVVEDIDVGDTNPFYTLPSVGGVPVCQADTPKTVTSLTPDICTIRDRQPVNDSGDATFELGWFDITGVSAGTCEYEVTYPAGNDGAGASATFTFEIEP